MTGVIAAGDFATDDSFTRIDIQIFDLRVSGRRAPAATRRTPMLNCARTATHTRP